MSYSDFAQTGQFFAATSTRPTRFHVIGERSTGTNYGKRIIGKNSSLKPTEALGWKHGHVQTMAVPADLIVVVMVRSADNWARSMHAKPWHSTPELQKLQFSDFIRAPWQTRIDHPKYFRAIAEDGALGQPLQQDRCPMTGQIYENLFKLRHAKQMSQLSFANRGCHFVLARMETVTKDPEGFMKGFHAAFGTTSPHDTFQPIHKRLGSRFQAAIDTRPETPNELSEADRKFLKDQIDPTQEAFLGYSYD